MIEYSFRERCQREWHRLNPRFVKQEDSLFQVLIGASRETVLGFFAPLRILWWLATKSWML